MVTASIVSTVTVGVISYNKSNDKNATVQENVPAVEEVPVKATCWIDGVKGTIYADWDMTQIIKEVTYDVDGYEDELLIIGSTLDGGTHAIAIYNGQYVVVNDAMWDHWYNGKSSAFD